MPGNRKNSPRWSCYRLLQIRESFCWGTIRQWTNLKQNNPPHCNLSLVSQWVDGMRLSTQCWLKAPLVSFAKPQLTRIIGRLSTIFWVCLFLINQEQLDAVVKTTVAANRLSDIWKWFMKFTLSGSMLRRQKNNKTSCERFEKWSRRGPASAIKK